MWLITSSGASSTIYIELHPRGVSSKGRLMSLAKSISIKLFMFWWKLSCLVAVKVACQTMLPFLVAQEQQEAFRRQEEAIQRAQKAEEERARSEAALHAMQQRNLQLQQQQEAQRLADLDRQRQQRFRQEEEQRQAQARHDLPPRLCCYTYT